MTARKNTATAVSGGRRTSKTTAPKTTSTGTTLALVDAVDTALVKAATTEAVKAAESAPKSDVTSKPAPEVKVAEKPAKPAKAKVPAKPKLEVTDADLAKLVYVPDSQGEKATTRHRESCPAYFDEKWGNATTFTKVTDKDRLAKLHACRSCARRTAGERVAAKASK